MLSLGLLNMARCAGLCYRNVHRTALQKLNTESEFTQVPNRSTAGHCKVPENNTQPKQLQVGDGLQVEGYLMERTEFLGIALGQYLAK